MTPTLCIVGVILLRLSVQVGDLVELSAAGRKILYCAKVCQKQGIVVDMFERGMYPIIIFWFGVGRISHRRTTLKLINKIQKKQKIP
jgi:hypothetical protein